MALGERLRSLRGRVSLGSGRRRLRARVVERERGRYGDEDAADEEVRGLHAVTLAALRQGRAPMPGSVAVGFAVIARYESRSSCFVYTLLCVYIAPPREMMK